MGEVLVLSSADSTGFSAPIKLELPTTATPSMQTASAVHWARSSLRPRNMTEKTPTHRTRHPRIIWKILCNAKKIESASESKLSDSAKQNLRLCSW